MRQSSEGGSLICFLGNWHPLLPPIHPCLDLLLYCFIAVNVVEMEEEIIMLSSRLKKIHIQRERLLKEEKEILRQLDDTRSLRQAGPFRIGDLVCITNRLGALSPLGRRATLSDRAAVVKQVDSNRVTFTTYRNRDSWRAPSNLRLLTDAERAQLE